ncbi:MAG: polyprenyl diphosphate synthase [Planctomycetota bacterium]|jgi:undecaprenyl diphosphate synthase
MTGAELRGPTTGAEPQHGREGPVTGADPRHLAIIMDGNGRWAKAQRLPRIRGHAAGVESVRTITRACARRKLDQLTLYAFSEENWKRPRREVRLLMRLLRRFLIRERDEIMENDIRLTAIGRLDRLPDDVRRELEITRALSAENTGMVLNLALSYGGRQELVDAMRAIGQRIQRGELAPDAITEELITAHLYQPDMPMPDLLVRTAGELRVSNFLLWQLSYTELYVTPACWPAFDETELEKALDSFKARVRKFGGLAPGNNVK